MPIKFKNYCVIMHQVFYCIIIKISILLVYVYSWLSGLPETYHFLCIFFSLAFFNGLDPDYFVDQPTGTPISTHLCFFLWQSSHHYRVMFMHGHLVKTIIFLTLPNNHPRKHNFFIDSLHNWIVNNVVLWLWPVIITVKYFVSTNLDNNFCAKKHGLTRIFHC